MFLLNDRWRFFKVTLKKQTKIEQFPRTKKTPAAALGLICTLGEIKIWMFVATRDVANYNFSHPGIISLHLKCHLKEVLMMTVGGERWQTDRQTDRQTSSILSVGCPNQTLVSAQQKTHLQTQLCSGLRSTFSNNAQPTTLREASDDF